MNLINYIEKDLTPLTLKDRVKDALHLCETFSTSHILVVEKREFIGCFSQSDAQSIQDKEQQLSNFTNLLSPFFTDNSASILELLTLFANNDANIIPVVNHQKYAGYFELSAVLKAFAKSPFIALTGFDLVVEKNNKEFSMSEIAQIVESNNAELLGSFIATKNNDKTQITLKIASEEINEIIQTFRRYNYVVITKHKDDEYLEELKDRANYLQKYLNI